MDFKSLNPIQIFNQNHTSGNNIFNSFDSDDLLNKQKFVLFKVFSIIGSIVSSAVFLKMLFTFQEIKNIHFILPISSILILINYWRVKSIKQLTAAYIALLLICFFLLHIVAYVTGGIQSASILYYPCLIFLAFMLLEIRLGLIFLAVFVIQILYLYYITLYTSLTDFSFLSNHTLYIQQDFLFNGLFSSILITSLCLYQFSGKNLIIKTITEQRDILNIKNQELKITNEELNKTNIELDKFVYSVSHDLRSPLSSIMGITNLMVDETKEPFILQSLEYIQSSVKKLDDFIINILSYSKNTRTEIQISVIHFEHLINQLIEKIKFTNQGTDKIQITKQIKQNSEFYSDITRVEIILNNLLSNAFKYYNPQAANPSIQIDILVNDQLAIIRVSDNGMGIKKELQSKVYDMFYRIHEDSTGSGLGLYIVKETLEKIGGSIDLISEELKGTEFTVTLPNLLKK